MTTGHPADRGRSFCWDTPFSRWFRALGRWDIGDYAEAFWDSAASTVPLMTWLTDAAGADDLIVALDDLDREICGGISEEAVGNFAFSLGIAAPGRDQFLAVDTLYRFREGLGASGLRDLVNNWVEFYYEFGGDVRPIVMDDIYGYADAMSEGWYDLSETVDLVRDSFRRNAADLENFRENVLMKALDGYPWLVGALCAETPDGVVGAMKQR